MKYLNKGSTYVVKVSAAEVDAFASKWPCSHLPDRPLWFEFQRGNGDLVDLSPILQNSRVDGSAVVALAEDARNWALSGKAEKSTADVAV